MGGIYTIEEIECAIEEVKPRKAKGPDLIMGIILNNAIAKAHVIKFVIEVLRSGNIPEYLK
jgi:hypothetical protein